MSGKDGSMQKAKSFIIDEIGQGTVTFMDEEFTMTKRFVERRSRAAAHVTVAPIDTAQYCSPRSLITEISSDVRVCMEKNEEGRMGKESDQLEPPSAITGFETPGQQCFPSWETGRTTAAGCLPVSVSSSFGGNSFSLAESAVSRREPMAKLHDRIQYQTLFSCPRAANLKT